MIRKRCMREISIAMFQQIQSDIYIYIYNDIYNLVLLSDLQTQTSVQKEYTTVKVVPYAITLKDPLYVSAGSQGTLALIAQVKLYTLKFYILLIKYIKDVWSPLRVVLNCARLSLQQVFKLASITHAFVNHYTCILLYFILLHIYVVQFFPVSF